MQRACLAGIPYSNKTRSMPVVGVKHQVSHGQRNVRLPAQCRVRLGKQCVEHACQPRRCAAFGCYSQRQRDGHAAVCSSLCGLGACQASCCWPLGAPRRRRRRQVFLRMYVRRALCSVPGAIPPGILWIFLVAGCLPADGRWQVLVVGCASPDACRGNAGILHMTHAGQYTEPGKTGLFGDTWSMLSPGGESQASL